MSIASLFRTAAGLIAVAALIVQYWLLVRNLGGDFGAATLRFLNYFTLLSNVVGAAAFLSPALAPGSAPGAYFSRPSVRTAVTLYLVVVGVVYHTLLASRWDPKGWQLAADIALHTIMPVAIVIDWLFLTGKHDLSIAFVPQAVLFPFGFAVWALAIGAVSGFSLQYIGNVIDFDVIRSAKPTMGVDPLGGAWFVEALTDETERQVWRYLDEIDRRGGMVAAVKEGYPQREIADAAYRYQREFDAGERRVVGVNAYVDESEVTRVPVLSVRRRAKTRYAHVVVATDFSCCGLAASASVTCLRRSATSCSARCWAMALSALPSPLRRAVSRTRSLYQSGNSDLRSCQSATRWNWRSTSFGSVA